MSRRLIVPRKGRAARPPGAGRDGRTRGAGDRWDRPEASGPIADRTERAVLEVMAS